MMVHHLPYKTVKNAGPCDIPHGHLGSRSTITSENHIPIPTKRKLNKQTK